MNMGTEHKWRLLSVGYATYVGNKDRFRKKIKKFFSK